jgi:hypothetical protein
MNFDETPMETIEAERARLCAILWKLLADLGDLDEEIDAIDRILDRDEEK